MLFFLHSQVLVLQPILQLHLIDLARPYPGILLIAFVSVILGSPASSGQGIMSLETNGIFVLGAIGVRSPT